MICTLSYTASAEATMQQWFVSLFGQQPEIRKGSLQKRVDSYQKTCGTISLFDQCRSLTAMRSDHDAFSQCSFDCQRRISRRQLKACRSCSSCIKKKTKPGIPSVEAMNTDIGSFGIPAPAKAIGIYVGVSKSSALSTGVSIPGKMIDKKRAKRKQRLLSQARRDSIAGHEGQGAHAKERYRIQTRRRGVLHGSTSYFVSQGIRNAIEDLRVGNMVRNPKLAWPICER